MTFCRAGSWLIVAHTWLAPRRPLCPQIETHPITSQDIRHGRPLPGARPKDAGAPAWPRPRGPRVPAAHGSIVSKVAFGEDRGLRGEAFADWTRGRATYQRVSPSTRLSGWRAPQVRQEGTFGVRQVGHWAQGFKMGLLSPIPRQLATLPRPDWPPSPGCRMRPVDCGIARQCAESPSPAPFSIARQSKG